MDENTPRQSGVQSIDRAVTILNCFSVEIEELSLGEIAQAAQLPKPTVYRLLSSLKQHQWIEQDEKTGSYRLGFRLYTLGAVVGSQMDLRRSALPMMQRLAEDTQETVDLNFIDRGERICMELVEGSHAIRNFVKIGTRNSLLAGASGKVLLARLMQAAAAVQFPTMGTLFTVFADVDGQPLTSPHLLVHRPFLKEMGFRLGDAGREWSTELPPPSHTVTKPCYSAFYGTPLDILLRDMGISRVAICGITANGGVTATARDAYLRDLQITILSDAVASFQEQAKQRALEELAGIALVQTAEEWIRTLPDTTRLE